MSLDTEEQIRQTWGSHQPVMYGLTRVLWPHSVIECGCGKYSTPWLQSFEKLLTIEHCPAWAKKMQKKYPCKHHKWIVQNFPWNNGTKISELNNEQYKYICNWYNTLADSLDPFDFLFMDDYLSCRVPATLSLGNKAQIILVHDMEPQSQNVYEWDRLDDFFKPWHKYIHKPMGFVNKKHQIPWTGVYSRFPLDLKTINDIVVPRSWDLWNQNVGLEEN